MDVCMSVCMYACITLFISISGIMCMICTIVGVSDRTVSVANLLQLVFLFETGLISFSFVQ